MQEPHEQRNRQEGKSRKHRTPLLHKSKHFAKAKSTITRLNNNRNHRKEHSESSLHQLTGSVFLSLRSPSDTVIPKCENFRNIIRRHRYLKTPNHTQRIFRQLPSLIRCLKNVRDTLRSRQRYNRSSSCSGRSMMNVAPCSSSSARGRNPHVTPTERRPLLAAVCISTFESPI